MFPNNNQADHGESKKKIMYLSTEKSPVLTHKGGEA